MQCKMTPLKCIIRKLDHNRFYAVCKMAMVPLFFGKGAKSPFCDFLEYTFAFFENSNTLYKPISMPGGPISNAHIMARADTNEIIKISLKGLKTVRPVLYSDDEIIKPGDQIVNVKTGQVSVADQPIANDGDVKRLVLDSKDIMPTYRNVWWLFKYWDGSALLSCTTHGKQGPDIGHKIDVVTELAKDFYPAVDRYGSYIIIPIVC